MEMNVFMQKLQIRQKACYIEQNGSGGPIILWGMYPHRGNEIAHMWDCLMETVNDQDFLFCAFQVKDWNGDFSPWKSPAAFGDDDFKGNGPKTLQWLMNDLIPKLKADYGVDREIYLIGYSLAGLFALWTAYETDIFSAIASCSGSLWFEQWDEYVLHHQIKHESNIYLSLGGKEEKTKNPVMARVGDRTRTQEQILRNDPKESQPSLTQEAKPKKKPIIICGDFNVAATELDLKNPKNNVKNAGFTPEEREKFKTLLDSGFTDSYRYLHPDTEKYSWWSYRFKARERNAGWRIDYFLTSDSIKDKIKDAEILTDVMGSDHCPIELDIDI